jgi:outer membrane protein OmpA-like peptidoglycan-associated protein
MKKIKKILIPIMLVSILLFSSLTSGLIIKKKQTSLTTTFDNAWTQIFGGEEIDQSFSIIEISDGYIIVGWTHSHGSGNSDVWLIKTDLNGNKVWDKTYGGKERDRGLSVKKTNDSGYIIVGYTESFGNGLFDLWLLKTDKNGNEEWNNTFGGGDYDYGLAVQQTKDEGFIITGYTSSSGPPNSNAWLIKSDKNGNKQWDKIFGGINCESGFSLLELNNGYIFAGYVESFGNGDYDSWAIRTDFSGNIIWNKTYGGQDLDITRTIRQTSDGNFIMAGWTESFGNGNEDVWLFKIDQNGEMIWSKTYGGELNDGAYSIYPTEDNGYIIAGYTNSLTKLSDIYLIKTDENGLKEWEKTYGGSLNDEANYILQTKDKGFIVAGWTKSYGNGKEDIWLIKTDENGNSKKDISKSGEKYYTFLNFILKDIFEKTREDRSFLLKFLKIMVSNHISMLVKISEKREITEEKQILI